MKNETSTTHELDNNANLGLPLVALDGFRQVTRDEFYNIVGKLDATLHVIGNYPYTTEFKLRHRQLIGKTVDSDENIYPIVTRYYISCNWR